LQKDPPFGEGSAFYHVSVSETERKRDPFDDPNLLGWCFLGRILFLPSPKSFFEVGESG